MGELAKVCSQIVLKCLYLTRIEIGTVSRLRFCRRPWGFKIYIRWNIVRFWKSYICSNKLDVQETNFSFAQFSRIRNHFFGCRIEVGWYPRTWFMGSDRRSSWKHNSGPWKNGETRLLTNVKFVQHLTQFKNDNNLEEWSMIWTMLILFPHTSILLVRKLLLYIFEDQYDHKGKKPYNEPCFQNPQSCSWLVVW